MPGTDKQPSQPSSVSSSCADSSGLTSTVCGTDSAPGYRGFAPTPKITTCSDTPICGAARPAPFNDVIVSCISAISACNSGESNCSTGLACCNKSGSPILSTERTAIVAKEYVRMQLGE